MKIISANKTEAIGFFDEIKVNKSTKAVIMAGGQGTRLQGVNKDIPKAMFPICGKPIIVYQLENLKKCGITDVIIIVGHLGDVIKDAIGDGSSYDVKVSYIIEESPLGTGGALAYLRNKIVEDFFLVFGDLVLDIDWDRFMTFHKNHHSVLTLFGHPSSHPFDSDLIDVDENGRVRKILSKKEKRDFYYHNLCNAGIYRVSKDVIDRLDATYPVRLDFDKDIMIPMIHKHEVFVYQSSEYVRDMGTPDRLKSVENDVRNKLIEKRSLCNPQKAIFLDRDGTINKLNGFISNPIDFELLDGVTNAIRSINKSGYLAIVITNQPVIARGECTVEGLDEIHKKMETLLGLKGAFLDAIYYCPHHPDKGFKGEVAELKMNCDCRKPKTGMIDRAVKRFNIDLDDSWFVGDSTMDVQTGINAGIKNILLYTGEGGKDGKYEAKADYEADSLLEAVNLVTESWKK